MSNICKRPPYSKSSPADKRRGNNPTAAQRAKWEERRALGCQVEGYHEGAIAQHHIETGLGRKKDHDRTISLCHNHHQGKDGFHTIGSKAWEAIHGTEAEIFDRQEALLAGG